MVQKYGILEVNFKYIRHAFFSDSKLQKGAG